MMQQKGFVFPAVCVLLAICALGCTCLKRDVNEAWSSSLSTSLPCSKFMSDSLLKVLTKPDSVVAYRLVYTDSISSTNSDDKFLCGRTGCGMQLSDPQVCVLDYLLLADSLNYIVDSVRVQSPCIPCLEFVYSKGAEDSVSIIIAESDMSWQIAAGGKPIYKATYADSYNIQRFCDKFFQVDNK